LDTWGSEGPQAFDHAEPQTNRLQMETLPLQGQFPNYGSVKPAETALAPSNYNALQSTLRLRGHGMGLGAQFAYTWAPRLGTKLPAYRGGHFRLNSTNIKPGLR